MEKPVCIKKFNEKQDSIQQECKELLQLIRLEIISFPGHFKPWLVRCLKDGHFCEHWDRTRELIKLCRVAILDKNWKPVRTLLCKYADKERKKQQRFTAERKKQRWGRPR